MKTSMMVPAIPEGVSGDWSVEKFVVSEEDSRFTRIRAEIKRNPWEYVPPGEYLKLAHRGHTVMSTTPSELRSNSEPMRHASPGSTGLINGLGLGCVLQGCLECEARHITVVEISPDVIKLVWPYFEQKYGDRVQAVPADARTWKKPSGVHYNFVWHDIWNSIRGENAVEIKKLTRRYAKCSDWQGAWLKEEQYKLDRDG